MPNIFDGLSKLQDDDIRLQIALFESVNVSGAVQETGHRTVSRIVGFANMLVGAGKIDYEMKGIVGVVKDKILSYKNMSRMELDEKLRHILVERITDEGNRQEFLSDDYISVHVIREAAGIYNLSTAKSPAVLADRIAEQYYDQFLTRLHKVLIKQEKPQAKETDQRLQDCLNRIPIEQKRELNRSVVMTEFSGRGIGKLIRWERSILNLKRVVTYMGLDAFDAMDVVIFSMYEKMIGFGRLTKMLLAQLICVAVKGYGAHFEVGADLLPSFVKTQTEVQINEERSYRQHLVQRVEMKDTITKYQQEIEKVKNDLMDMQVRLLEDNARFNEAKDRFDELEKRKEESADQAYFREVNSAKKELDQADATLKNRTMSISESKIRQSELDNLLSQTEKQLGVIEMDTQEITNERSSILARQWRAFFYKFRFADDDFTYLVENFTASELMRIEMLLKEMHDCKDIEAYAKEHTEDAAHAVCEVSEGKTVSIFYVATFIRKIIKEQK